MSKAIEDKSNVNTSIKYLLITASRGRQLKQLRGKLLFNKYETGNNLMLI